LKKMKNRGFLLLIFCCGCTFLDATGDAVGVVGKVGWEAGKAVGGAVYTGTSMAGQTANQANKTMSRPSERSDRPPKAMLSGGRTVIPLVKEGNSFYVRVKLNDKLWGKFLVDTGASAMQISGAMEKKLKVKPERGRMIPVSLAGGAMVAGRLVILKKVQLGAASVENVRAIVLEGDNQGMRDGLLGMSFLENFVFQIDARRGELILRKR
jgi:clan AA aspartic protease (TIGR02281 family)